jgi:hypothetical protein
MGHYQLLVFSNPVEGREQEYNDWYTNRHIHDIVKLPGFVSAQRFEVKGEAPHRYLAIYDMECADPLATYDELVGLAGSDAVPMSDALDLAGSQALIYEPISGKVVG